MVLILIEQIRCWYRCRRLVAFLGHHVRSFGFGGRWVRCTQPQKLETPTQTIAEQQTSGFTLHLLLALPFKAHAEPFPQDEAGRLPLEPFVPLLLKTRTQPLPEEQPRGSTHLPFVLPLALETYPEPLPQEEPVDSFDI